jgi:HSP90 family molecular chaperone
MKLTRILSFATALLVLASPAAFAGKVAGKGDPAKKAARQAARKASKAAAPFDKNSDGSITGDESAELRKAFEADKTGPLKTFDLNADGTLDDNEIAAIKIGKHAGKAANAGKKKKNAI